MRLRAALPLFGVMSAVLASCAKPTLYQGWGQQLVNMPRHNGRLEDASMLLGGPPSHCETIEEPDPVIGVRFDQQNPVIEFVYPRTPAEQAGLAVGDAVSSIAGRAVVTTEEAIAGIRLHSREGEPLEVHTNRGAIFVTPTVPSAKQCYWEIRAGEISRGGGAAVVNQWGGSAGASSAAYQRFFRASCRIHDSYVVGCQANWQE